MRQNHENGNRSSILRCQGSVTSLLFSLGLGPSIATSDRLYHHWKKMKIGSVRSKKKHFCKNESY